MPQTAASYQRHLRVRRAKCATPQHVATPVSDAYRVGMSEVAKGVDPRFPACGQPLRRGGHMSPENAAFLTASGNAGITFETQGRCENEACVDFGREFAPDEWLHADGQ
jgi:hypothetical protein